MSIETPSIEPQESAMDLNKAGVVFEDIQPQIDALEKEIAAMGTVNPEDAVAVQEKIMKQSKLDQLKAEKHNLIQDIV